MAIQRERELLRGLAEVERDHQAAPECAGVESPRPRRLVTPVAQEARAWRFFSKIDGDR